MNTHNLLRPEKIQWVFPTISENWVEAIPSKSSRKLIRKFPQILQENNLQFTWKEATEEDYLEWLEFYKQKMPEQNHEILAKPEWYQQKLLQKKQVYLLECRDTLKRVRLGGEIVVKTEDNTWTSAYKATERVDLTNEQNISLGILFDIEYLRYVQEQNPQKITGGTSRNAFGHINTIGYLNSKLRKGFLPVMRTENMLHDFPQDPGVPTIWFVRDSQTQEEFFLLSEEESKYSEEFFHFCTVQNIRYEVRTTND